MDKTEILAQAKALEETLIAHRRFLHAHPETGFSQEITLPYVKNTLVEMGYAPSECGKAGLLATVGSGSPVLLLRADMDALPIREEADVPFASTNGNMHACGHDLHTAMLLGAASLLKAHEKELHGTVKLMFQSAEEIFEGSRDMIENGALHDPDVNAALMIHVTAGVPIPAGTVLVSSAGVSAPAADYFSIDVQGKGCHGSAPQNGIDAITVAAHILIALQEISARELSPSDEAVLTIGTFHGGSAENVIADSAHLGGTIRTYSEETRKFLKTRIDEIATSVAIAFRAKATVQFGSGCPTLVNDKQLSTHAEAWLKELLGENGAFSTASLSPDGKPQRGGGSEDFAYISHEVPSLMLALCAGEPKDGYAYPQHHPKVTFDEQVLPIGSAVFTWFALRYLQ